MAGVQRGTAAVPPWAELPAQTPLEAAAELLGCSLSAVEKYLGLTPLDKLRRGAEPPQITAEGIRELAERLAPAPPIDLAVVRPRAALALARPPADGDTWLTTTAAAELLGVTQRTVRKRAEEGTIPFTEHQGRRWYRRIDVGVLAAARAFREVERVGHGAEEADAKGVRGR